MPRSKLRHVVESLRREFVGLLHGDRDRFLDPRQIDDALAQHRLAHLAEFEVLFLGAVALGRRGRASGRMSRTS